MSAATASLLVPVLLLDRLLRDPRAAFEHLDEVAAGLAQLLVLQHRDEVVAVVLVLVEVHLDAHQRLGDEEQLAVVRGWQVDESFFPGHVGGVPDRARGDLRGGDAVELGLLAGVGDQRPAQHVGGDVADDVVPDPGDEQHGVLEILQQAGLGGPTAGECVRDGFARLTTQAVAAARAAAEAEVGFVGLPQPREQASHSDGVVRRDRGENRGEERVQQLAALSAPVALQ